MTVIHFLIMKRTNNSEAPVTRKILVVELRLEDIQELHGEGATVTVDTAFGEQEAVLPPPPQTLIASSPPAADERDSKDRDTPPASPPPAKFKPFQLVYPFEDQVKQGVYQEKARHTAKMAYINHRAEAGTGSASRPFAIPCQVKWMPTSWISTYSTLTRLKLIALAYRAGQVHHPNPIEELSPMALGLLAVHQRKFYSIVELFDSSVDLPIKSDSQRNNSNSNFSNSPLRSGFVVEECTGKSWVVLAESGSSFTDLSSPFEVIFSIGRCTYIKRADAAAIEMMIYFMLSNYRKLVEKLENVSVHSIFYSTHEGLIHRITK